MKSSPRTSIRLTEFSLKVIEVIKKIPRGKVATYSQVARLAGKPHAARGVGWILNSCTEKYRLPWQRVLNSQGKISFSPKSDLFKKQKSLLEREGVKFRGRSALDLATYQWKKSPRRRPAGAKPAPRMFED